MEFKGTKEGWCSDYNGVQTNSGNKICTMVEGTKTSIEVNANISIMAASTDMLRALQWLIDPLTGLVADFVEHEIGSEKAYAIEQAIEKALK